MSTKGVRRPLPRPSAAPRRVLPVVRSARLAAASAPEPAREPAQLLRVVPRLSGGAAAWSHPGTRDVLRETVWATVVEGGAGAVLAADAAVGVVATAALSVPKPVAAGGTLSVTTSASLTVGGATLAAAATVAVVGAGALSVDKPLAATATAAITAAAALTVPKPLAASATAAVTATADLTGGAPTTPARPAGVVRRPVARPVDIGRRRRRATLAASYRPASGAALGAAGAVSVTATAAFTVGTPLAAAATLSIAAGASLSGGSVGTRALVLLLESGDGEPLLLQVKQANESVLEPYLGASVFDNHGKRVVVGQRVMQTTGDPFLGWAKGTQAMGDFYVRQLKDMKGSIDVTLLDKEGLIGYGQVCGAVLARAHARAGDASLVTGYLGESTDFDEAVADFSMAYAQINASDHAALVASILGS